MSLFAEKIRSMIYDVFQRRRLFGDHESQSDGCWRKEKDGAFVRDGQAHLKLGRAGEKLARRYLEKLGYRHLKSNYAAKQGEVDLIMQDGRTVVFVEVKTRRKEDYVDSEAVVNYHKQKHITAAARQFIHVNNLHDYAGRFDVVVVLKPSKGKAIVRHHQNAFRYRGR